MKEYQVVTSWVKQDALFISKELRELIEKYAGWDYESLTLAKREGIVVVFSREKPEKV